MINKAIKKANDENSDLHMERSQDLFIKGGTSLQKFHTDFNPNPSDGSICNAWSVHMPLTALGSKLDIGNPHSRKFHRVENKYGELFVVRGDVAHRGTIHGNETALCGLRYFCGIGTEANPLKDEIHIVLELENV